MLTAIILCPLIGALLLCVVPRTFTVVMRTVSMVATFLSMLLAIILFWCYDNAPVLQGSLFKFEYIKPWVTSLGINYHVGVDGINVGLILMGAVDAFAAACCGWEIRERDNERQKEFCILLLIMSGGILWAFSSL